MYKYAAVIVAGGSSNRMGGIDKILFQLCGRPVLQYSLEQFIRSNFFSQIVVVTSSQNMNKVNGILTSLGNNDVKVVMGGKRRQDSVLKGLGAISVCDYVAIHDGARPLVSQEILNLGAKCVEKVGAAIPVVPLQDTVKKVNLKSFVSETIDRGVLRAVQTPQFFDYNLIKQAHHLVDEDVTDDSTMVELIGNPVSVFPGDPNNIKISSQSDLVFLELIIAGQKNNERN